MEIVEAEVKKILKKILKLPDKGFIPYAKSYARAGLGMTGYELKIQVLYILNNLVFWRGEEARTAKAYLKGYATSVNAKGK